LGFFIYFYAMISDELKANIITFFETIDKYYGSKTEITSGLFSKMDNVNAALTTWNLSEFNLIRSAYRNNGGKFMFEGNGNYFEIASEKLIDFKHPGRHKFEFIEQYGENVFRITKIRFHYKY